MVDEVVVIRLAKEIVNSIATLIISKSLGMGNSPNPESLKSCRQV